uniref:Secreted protein n=1 Tax=Lepeophtheirus salmonis TaxID=72036 RepID=A0A0K2TJL7_LEPSM
MHQVKKLVFVVFCFLCEVVNSKTEGIPIELHYWIVALEVRKIVLKLMQHSFDFNDGFVLENVADATSSLATLKKPLRRSHSQTCHPFSHIHRS